ncbi:MAG: Bro-N domain-containing protein [Candidatus Bathyarchaeota archaeon]|nr:Bro-N domain-containing protein [Candidatus Termiticorpusculum sp.]
MDDNNVKLFESKRIRTVWDEEKQEWYFSIVDIVSVLTEQPTHDGARKYWSVLKTRLKQEGSELTTICSQLKMQSVDGKFYKTDVADTKGILRIIQSIPSPKAEPFKLWLASVGKDRIDEAIDPELTIDRALATYLRKGYSREWINQRLQAIQVRKELVDEWSDRGVKHGSEYAILTDEITKAWAGVSTRQYKQLKGLKKESLRDNMSMLELTLNQLAEVTTTTLSKKQKPQTFDENVNVARQGGGIAGDTRKAIEKASGEPVITSKKAVDFARLLADVIEDKDKE